MPGRVVEHGTVVAAAHRQFAAAADVDMDALARQLAVSRATLYRVVGSRDRLLGDVLWVRGRRGMSAAEAAAEGAGVDRVVDVARRFNETVVADAPLRAFLARDPATAFRVLFTPEGRVHDRFVELWSRVLGDEVAAGRLTLTTEPGAMAFLFVRLGESVLYADLLGGRRPDLDLAAQVQRALLTSATAPT